MIEAGTVLAVARITITEVYDGVQGEPGVDANLLEWVEEWNSNLTMIDSNMVVTPKIFAGVKNSSNTITGVALGNFSMLTRQDNGEFVVENVNGLYGFWEGLKTFSIDSSGDVTFGRNDHYIKYTASTGLIEFGAGVAMAWVGATYIDKDGIFTGTLSADSVNAISLSAVQITSGTLSADRIAAGSITATHLDATSIKSNIINTDYINGLSCTFTKGTIGGWSIASGNITCGQIMLNSTSNRIAVYGSTSSSTSGHRVQFYYTSDTNFGFYATNSSGVCIAQLGSANQIAGWQITSSAIYKNSVYLGSDGSIYNGTKWKLANDGSGQLANSNIKWDASGNVTFSSAVSLLWSAPISELSESIDGDVLPKLTQINSSGIYTGTLTASQITAGTISASRIDVASIKASILTADNINALTLTSTKGTIGGWSIISTAIYKNSVYFGSDGSIYNGTKWKLNNDGSGSIASGNISWDASGNVSFSSAVSLLWSAPISELSESIDDDVLPKLTKISSTGIYTGTLTATQVNAVAISASSITTGTLSADRIAAGSIYASKLNAASIQSDIINATYINGLTCTFTKGIIGGWSIASGVLSSGQLALNATSKRIAVYGASSSTTTGHRVQLFYTSNTSFGFYATNSAGSCIAQLGSSNQISGWQITSSYIYKNSVYLGSDGSIYNGTKWKLNNDGSGSLASGNISWDASGNVSFASSVALNWTTLINQGKLYVRGTGYNNAASRLVILNGTTVVNNSTRGLSVTVINRSTLAFESTTNYDVYSSETYCTTMATQLDSLSSDKIVVITSCDAIRVNATLSTALQRCGASDWTTGAERIPYALIGIPTIGKNNGIEARFTTSSTDPCAEMSTTIENG
ncbi:MAG: interleukin-like EMT inducer domain-containing protein, partial [Bacillota bacterium]